MKSGFTIKTVTVTSGGFTYRTHKLTGWLDGKRIRRQFTSRAEAEGERNRLEVAAANRSGDIQPRNTRLSAAQLADAESAFARLGDRSLAAAVDWYLTNYRPPVTAMPISSAAARFLAERAPHVRAVVLRNYRHTLAAIEAAFAGRCVDEVTSAELHAFLTARQVGPKRFNNLRGELHTFFAFCQSPIRAWVRENPAVPIPAFKLARGIPEIISARRVGELMAYVEGFSGGPRSGQPRGFLAPYFALCLFAGLRPSVKDGEMAKLASSSDLMKSIDVELGVIRLTPEQSKVKTVRQVKIRPNLAAWLSRYPVDKFPLLPRNATRMVNAVRHKFGIGPDVLRHTFISMHVGAFRSLGDAALEAGNSETMIRRHYLNLVSEAEAAEFWRIVPSN